MSGELQVLFAYEGQSVELHPRALRSVEKLGAHSRFELDCVAEETMTAEDILACPCTISLSLPDVQAARVIRGVVTRFGAVATAQTTAARRYRLVITSSSFVLTLRRRSRIFREMTIPDIIAQILEESGLCTEPLKRELAGSYQPHAHVTQYGETEAVFVQRLCEEEGLWLRFESSEQSEVLVLCDNVAAAPEPLADPLPLTEEAGLRAPKQRAWNCRLLRSRASGWVTERDYNHEQPAVNIEGEAKGGVDHEQRQEVYRAPDHAAELPVAKQRSQLLLEGLRAKATSLNIQTDALALFPGVRVRLTPAADYFGHVPADENLFVVETRHEWSFRQSYRHEVRATPAAIPFRLAQRSPKPKIHGLQSAIVTGPPGEEIHPDELGRVRVRFMWDRDGPTDDKSSLPVRVLQPNLAGSMLLPRIGWEVWTAFEDGDPDRPYVLGRAYTAKQPPPLGLPGNKTMTSLATPTSPGSKCVNSIQYQDAANKQGMNWKACTDLVRSVGDNMKTVTVGGETYWVGGAQLVTVKGSQKESVQAVRVMSADTQLIDVGGRQTLSTPQGMDVKVGSETVAQANLMEYVGNPANAVSDLLATVVFTGAGFFLNSKGAQFALGLVKAAHAGFKEGVAKGGVSGAIAVGKELVGMLPVVGGLFGIGADVAEGAEVAPWQGGKKPWQLDPKTLAAADKAANAEVNSTVGGVAGSGAPAPGAAGPGHRIHKVAGVTVETIGGAFVIATPGPSKWTTLGASSFVVGGSHGTAAGKTNWMSVGLGRISTGAFSIKAASVKPTAPGVQPRAGPFPSNPKGP